MSCQICITLDFIFAKVNEIAFINSLEAQNKKIEVQEKHQVSIYGDTYFYEIFKSKSVTEYT